MPDAVNTQLTEQEEEPMPCDFSQSGYYPGDEVCPTADLKTIELKVVATGAVVWLTLCSKHRLALLDKAYARV